MTKERVIGFLTNLIKGKSNNLLIQLFRYTFVGGAAFIVDYGLLYVLTEYAGLHYLVSATISFIVGLLVNYFISTIWVFGDSAYNKTTSFIFFASIGVVGLVLNDVFIVLFTQTLSMHYMLSKLITAILVYLWNFLGIRFLIFTRNN
jgi:putative flippase GtrA